MSGGEGSKASAGRIIAALWLAGLPIAVLGAGWFAGLILIIGVASIVQGLLEGRPLRGFQIGCGSIGLILWITRQDSPLGPALVLAAVVLLVVAVLRSMAYRPPAEAKLSKDDLLE